MKPTIEEAERTLKVRFLSVNLDGWGNYDMEKQYSIDGTPALVWFIDGKPKWGLSGVRELKEIERATEKAKKR
jgi:thioredoxin-like negative regulator of GroEL